MILRKDNTIEEFKKGIIYYKNRTDRVNIYTITLPKWTLSLLLEYDGLDKDFNEYVLNVVVSEELKVGLYKTRDYNVYMLSVKPQKEKLLNTLKIGIFDKKYLRMTIPKYDKSHSKGIISNSVIDFDVIFFNKMNNQNAVYFRLIKRYAS